SDSQGKFVAAGTVLSFNPSDLVAPTVTVALATGQAATTKTGPIHFTVQFSEAVTDFTDTSVTIGGTAAGTIVATVTPSGDDGVTYDVAVSGIATDGTVILTVAANKVHDAVGNGNEASTGTHNTVTYDTTAPTVTIGRASDQAVLSNASELKFVVTFSESVSGFTAEDVTLAGTATGAHVESVTGSGSQYTVIVSGMTADGTVIVSVGAGVAQDAAGNLNTASSNTDGGNIVSYDHTSPTVTINQATTQVDPTGSSTVHFTVVFDEIVGDFTADDLIFGGTAKGKLTATVTKTDGMGKTYDVAVVGMTTSGTVTATIAAAKAHDTAGNANVASTSTDNTVQFVLSQKPTFAMTVPVSGSYHTGEKVVLAWKTTNAIANTSISLCYDQDSKWFNGNEHWIEIDQVAASSGYGTYEWTIPSNLAAGTYYIAGYLYSAGPLYSHLTQAITILGAAQPSFAVTAPTSMTYSAGQTATIAWKGQNIPSGAVVSFCYDPDNRWNGNETWIKVDQAATTDANGFGAYQWNTAGLKAGTYYVGGYLWANGKPVYSHLTQSITVKAGGQATFRITEPVSGKYNLGATVPIVFNAQNVPTGAKVSLCVDSDARWNGNEKWIEVDQVSAAEGYSTYQWDTAGMKAGTYYVAGYLWTGTSPIYSHQTGSISLNAALTLDATGTTSPETLMAADVLQTQSELAPIVQEAMQRWSALAGSEALAGVSVQIADLPGNLLAETDGRTVRIDRDAAGDGWFIDPTPNDDAEFTQTATGSLTARQGTAAQNRVDLLTAVMHELGHVLGYGHDSADDLMNASLSAGVRRTAVDQALAALYE
ncbi:MAG: Ig-like domain-containing protein, partial [Thermoguttaceae bacterium]